MATQSSDSELAATEIHDVLRNDRRRLALKCLQDAEAGGLTVRELSERVATMETGEEPAPRDKRQSVYVSLHQTHLPKLDRLGIVGYDDADKTVALAERAPEVTVYMEVVPRYGLSWAEYYLGVGLLGALATVAVLIGVPGISRLGLVAVAGGFFALVTGSAAYQIATQQDGSVFRRFRG
ncbi:DUF7344 domain-containing protein [Halosegnis marinus]|uniref:DUF7344 domain-containing protein n=1 Tax=Halosegnis marinus TaxID=3034023 RepID=A0ABD5ZRX4_9EURY|nr:hypothetical protein [Halosegnis sp. DT85]